MTFSGPDWSVWVYDSSFEPPITPICATGKNTISVATPGSRSPRPLSVLYYHTITNSTKPQHPTCMYVSYYGDSPRGASRRLLRGWETGGADCRYAVTI